jgi:hypothetical protein
LGSEEIAYITLLTLLSVFFDILDKQLIQSCADMFMAGADTTGDYLEFAILYMLKFPEVQRRVQEEIESVVPPGHVPTLSDRERLNS